MFVFSTLLAYVTKYMHLHFCKYLMYICAYVLISSFSLSEARYIKFRLDFYPYVHSYIAMYVHTAHLCST